MLRDDPCLDLGLYELKLIDLALTFTMFEGGFALTCSPSAEGSDSVITFDVSAIFLFFPLFLDVSGLLLLIL